MQKIFCYPIHLCVCVYVNYSEENTSQISMAEHRQHPVEHGKRTLKKKS